MEVHIGYNDLHLVNPVATLGIFDGVHRGHRSLLDRLVRKASELHGESVVITFTPHPRFVLGQDPDNLSFLTTTEEKTALLEEAGVDHLIMLKFDLAFSRIAACDFVKEVLVGRLGIRYLILGYDHHFGQGGEGNYDTIKECSESMNFDVEQVHGLHTEEGGISSSAVRDALVHGKLDVANNWLGYFYSITGRVVEGRKIGRSLGFPTANIEAEEKHKLIPGNGVYAVEVRVSNLLYPGMLSIGFNPTINSEGAARSVEVHILNFDGDLYGKRITVIFRKRLRNEKKFKSVEQLAEQMEIDKQITMQLLS